jgi:hypothetical protein
MSTVRAVVLAATRAASIRRDAPAWSNAGSACVPASDRPEVRGIDLAWCGPRGPHLRTREGGEYVNPEMPLDESTVDGISRRRVLKRIGAGMAIAWTAPVLTSIKTPAFAQTPSGCGIPGETCFTCDPRELNCNGDPTCGCTPTTESDCFCVAPQGCDQQLCTSSADCPTGRRCVMGCCPAAICAAACGSSNVHRRVKGRSLLPG